VVACAVRGPSPANRSAPQTAPAKPALELGFSDRFSVVVDQ